MTPEESPLAPEISETSEAASIGVEAVEPPPPLSWWDNDAVVAVVVPAIIIVGAIRRSEQRSPTPREAAEETPEEEEEQRARQNQRRGFSGGVRGGEKTFADCDDDDEEEDDVSGSGNAEGGVTERQRDGAVGALFGGHGVGDGGEYRGEEGGSVGDAGRRRSACSAWKYSESKARSGGSAFDLYSAACWAEKPALFDAKNGALARRKRASLETATSSGAASERR